MYHTIKTQNVSLITSEIKEETESDSENDILSDQESISFSDSEESENDNSDYQRPNSIYALFFVIFVSVVLIHQMPNLI